MKKVLQMFLLTAVMMLLCRTSVLAQQMPDVYGYMRTSATWGAQGTSYNPKMGFYRIATDENGQASFTRLTSDNALVITDGAVYVENQVYGLWSEVIKAFLGTYRSSMRTFDGITLAQTATLDNENKEMFATSLTYDYSTSTLFATSPKSYNSDDNPEVDFQLKSIDLATGQTNVIGIMGARVMGIVADRDGQLWGVGSAKASSVTNLYRIDKATGKATLQQTLDVYNKTNKLSMMCDMLTGKIYMVCETYRDNADLERTFHYGIYEIDTTSGRTTCVSTFPSEELFLGCYFIQSHPKAPAAAVLEKEQINASGLTFTLPTTTYDGSQALTGTLDAEIVVDNTIHINLTGLTPGELAQAQFAEPLSSGENHTVVVVVENGVGKSIPARMDVYVGNDSPAAVTDIVVEESNNSQTAHITWTAPTLGANGGAIDTEKLTYRVTRKPENKLLAQGLTTCEFTDNLDRVMGVTQYQIEAVIDGDMSAPAYSAILTLGTPHPIPYLQMFASTTDWMSYTVVDNNGDANNTNGGTWYHDYTNQVAMFFTNQQSADDYLFTPTLQLDPSKIYRLQFQGWGYHDNGSVNHIQVHLATTPTAEGVTATFMDDYFPNKSQALAYGLFRPQEGDCRLAFHNISDVVKDGGFDHFYLDNILVQEYGSAYIPAAPTDLEATRMAAGTLRVRFKAPTATVGGDELTTSLRMEICQAGNSAHPLMVLADVAPGEQCEAVIEPPYVGQLTLAVCAVTDDGRGMEANIITDTRNDIPAAVTDIRVEGKNAYTIAEITWQQSAIGVNGNLINLDDITYNIYRYVGVYRSLLAEGVRGTSYTDRSLTDALGSRQQDYVSYVIEPVTDGGKGAQAQSAETLLGRSYDLPFAESFASQQTQTDRWSQANMQYQGGSWGLAATGYDPYTQAQDGDGGLLTFSTSRTYPDGETDYLSPRIDVSNYSQPVATFYVYRGTQYSSNTRARLQAGVYTPETGAVMLTEVISAYSTVDGWERVRMAIPSPYAESDHLQLAFRAATNNYQASVHLDNISVTGQRAEYEVKAERISGNNECVAGQDNEYTVYVRNVGSRDVKDVTVTLTAADKLVGTQMLEKLVTGDMQPVLFHVMPSLGAKLGTMTLTANIACATDGSDANNTISTTVDLIAPMLPLIGDLQMEVVPAREARRVKLTWSENTQYPRQEYVTEDCEAIQPFAIQNMNGWTTIDIDQAKTIRTSLDGVSMLEWDNSGDPQAWIAFNIHRAGMDGYATAHSGSQAFVSFESTAAAGNDDWLVSPQLSGEEQTLSFYAKAFYPYLLDEQFEIWISRSVADDITRFERISGSAPVSVTSADSWTAFNFTLPEGTRYAAIRCVSKGQYGLMIDDITYSPMHTPLEFWGYNVYRNGILITEEPVADPEFVDEEFNLSAVADYNVTALYDLGESVFSNTVTYDPAADAIHTPGADTRTATLKYQQRGQVYIRTPHNRTYILSGARK